MVKQDIEKLFLTNIFYYIQDGIIVMTQSREIVKMNPAAERLSGWKIGDKVPYCSFCQQRKLCDGEERCYLISREEVPYFLSEMPTYHGNMIDVEMSTALIFEDDESKEKYYLLVLRDQALKKNEEEARISKLMLKRLTEAKEMEHKRLAQELHDGVGQSLFSIAIALDNVITRVQDIKLHEYINEVRAELGKVMEDVKSYSQQLRPKSLDELGLIPTIISLIQSSEKKMSGSTFHFSYNFNERLHPLLEINLYRVIQEALHNIMKYSHATEVNIKVEKKADTIFISIIDNGVGFQLDEKKEGLGLKHMQERISQIQGTMVIHSDLNHGTAITMNVPMNMEVEDESFNRG
ncbi:ATPase [Heyndrickxia shackletonii]|uniref:Sensor histidine kinase n=1 Tax=Heyndrickxia shackletonii TaxID=157838 RepID=A0A0Q3TEI5_9BACI|nr:PAS domain-containing sensor histidine kinase [Heyndrickxia shackletonii]KQL52504.1 ATPase [Heyndrickxia shackletonii]NEZ02352.1 PAS domain S-box protein [Heyndrickxia shackletonii]